MDLNLSIDSLTFLHKFSDKEGSVRTESSRGVNLPTTLKIAHSPYVDSATKLPGVRSVARFDRTVDLTGGKTAPVSAYIVVTSPNDPAVLSSDILAVVQHLVTLVQEDDSGLNLMDDIFVKKLQ
jgi:hypothetical protein